MESLSSADPAGSARRPRVLLLAAGRGRRAGGPKAWRPHDGTTLLEAHLDFFRGLFGASRISVAIQEEWRERCAALSPETTWVAADPDASPLDTLQKLIAASPAELSFVLHVDMPVFDRGVYEALLRCEGFAVVPSFDGRRGHPVLLTAEALTHLSLLDPAKDRLDVWLKERGAEEVCVAVPSVHLNLNEAAA
jgi:CTP:molybdopterin cytidylyltransferase MocA